MNATMKPEIKLLKKMAKGPRTLFPEKNIYSLGDYVANIESLIEQGYIQKRIIMNPSEGEQNFYEITINGYLLLKDLEDKKWQIASVIISAIILVLTILFKFLI